MHILCYEELRNIFNVGGIRNRILSILFKNTQKANRKKQK